MYTSFDGGSVKTVQLTNQPVSALAARADEYLRASLKCIQIEKNRRMGVDVAPQRLAPRSHFVQLVVHLRNRKRLSGKRWR